jgi:DNA end-binding protein Ku
VSCPIALHSAVRGGNGLHFHLINPKTGHRVGMISQDTETEEEVSRGDLVKGYEFEKDRYILLDDDDFEQARIDSSGTLTIGKFVDAASIEPIFFDTSYYVAPDGLSGQDVFVVLRDVIRKSRVAALSRVVIARRERAVAIIPSGDGMVCHTLHEPADLWDARPLAGGYCRGEAGARHGDTGYSVDRAADWQISSCRHRGPERGEAASGYRGQAEGRRPHT